LPVESVGFSPDGLTLATGNDTTFRLWKGIVWRHVADLNTAVCKIEIVLGRSLKELARDQRVPLPQDVPDTSCRG
jgi:hypothetical protein